MEKAREFQKSIYFCFIDYAKAFDCLDHNKLWKILKEMEIHIWQLRQKLKLVRNDLTVVLSLGGWEGVAGVCREGGGSWKPWGRQRS